MVETIFDSLKILNQDEAENHFTLDLSSESISPGGWKKMEMEWWYKKIVWVKEKKNVYQSCELWKCDKQYLSFQQMWRRKHW